MLRISSHPRLLLSLVLLSVCAMAWPAAATDLKLSTSSLSFVAVTGSTSVPAQGFSAYASPATSGFSPQVTASTQSGGQWLAVSSAAGGSMGGGVDVKVSVNVAGLAAGDYSGSVTVSQAGLNGSPATVAVSLKVIPAVPYLSITPGALTFSALTGANPSPQSIYVQNAGAGTIAPKVTATTANGSNWLVVSQPTVGSFANSTIVVVQAQTASLPPATYNGTITVTSAGALNSPVNVPVTLTVGTNSGATITLSPSSISFVAGLGAQPRVQGLMINNTGSGTLKPVVTSTGSWLAVSQAIGGSLAGTTSDVQVKADITGLSKGTYNGSITVSDPNSTNGSVTVPVTLTLTDPQPVMAILPVLWYGFSTPANAILPLVNGGLVENIGTGAMPWTATVSPDAPWLNVDSGGTAAFLSGFEIAVNPVGLAPGIYNGTITFNAPSVVSGPATQTVRVTLAVGTDLPAPSDNGIVNGASFASHTVAPGSIVSIFGDLMGPTAGLQSNFVGNTLPTDLGSVQVLFSYSDANGNHTTAAPLYYAAKGQVNAQIPNELAGQASATMQVVYNNLPSRALTVYLKSTDPGVFGGYAGGQPIICFNNTKTIVTAQTPAKAGDYLVIYATGLGLAYDSNNSALPAGAPAPSSGNPLYSVNDPVSVNIGGTTVPALFAGLTPGFVGLYQINVQVPNTVVSGPNSLILTVGGQQTAPLTLNIK